jgi:septal ring factor EnvC (AmiA/AmiB activator)
MENLDKPKPERQQRDVVDKAQFVAIAYTAIKSYQIDKGVKNILSEMEEASAKFDVLKKQTDRIEGTVGRIEERQKKQIEEEEKKKIEEEYKANIRKMANAIDQALDKIEENDDLVYKYLFFIYCDDKMVMNNINNDHFGEFVDLEHIGKLEKRIDELEKDTKSKFSQIDIDDLNLIKDINKDSEETLVADIENDIGDLNKEIRKLKNQIKRNKSESYLMPATEFITEFGESLSVVDQQNYSKLYQSLEKFDYDIDNDKPDRDVLIHQKNNDDYNVGLRSELLKFQRKEYQRQKPILLTLLEIPWSLYFPQYEIFQEYKWKSLKMAFITILAFWIPLAVIGTIMGMMGTDFEIMSILRGWISLSFHGIAFLFIIFFILATIQWFLLIFIALINFLVISNNGGLPSSSDPLCNNDFWCNNLFILFNLISLSIYAFFISVKYCIRKLNKVWEAKKEELQLSQKDKNTFKDWIRERSQAEKNILEVANNFEKNKREKSSKINEEINILEKEKEDLQTKKNNLNERINWEIDQARNLANRRPFLGEFVKNRLNPINEQLPNS